MFGIKFPKKNEWTIFNDESPDLYQRRSPFCGDGLLPVKIPLVYWPTGDQHCRPKGAPQDVLDEPKRHS